MFVPSESGIRLVSRDNLIKVHDTSSTFLHTISTFSTLVRLTARDGLNSTTSSDSPPSSDIPSLPQYNMSTALITIAIMLVFIALGVIGFFLLLWLRNTQMKQFDDPFAIPKSAAPLTEISLSPPKPTSTLPSGSFFSRLSSFARRIRPRTLRLPAFGHSKVKSSETLPIIISRTVESTTDASSYRGSFLSLSSRGSGRLTPLPPRGSPLKPVAIELGVINISDAQVDSKEPKEFYVPLATTGSQEPSGNGRPVAVGGEGTGLVISDPVPLGKVPYAPAPAYLPGENRRSSSIRSKRFPGVNHVRGGSGSQ